MHLHLRSVKHVLFEREFSNPHDSNAILVKLVLPTGLFAGVQALTSNKLHLIFSQIEMFRLLLSKFKVQNIILKLIL